MWCGVVWCVCHSLQVDTMSVDNWVYLTDSSFTTEALVAMEDVVLQVTLI